MNRLYYIFASLFLSTTVMALKVRTKSPSPPPIPASQELYSEGIGVFGHCEVLYWTSQSTDLPICIVGDVGGGSSSSLVNQSILSIPLGWTAGFDVGLGFDVPTCDWSISADWTRFHNSATRNLSTTLPSGGTPTSGRFIMPIWSQIGNLPSRLKGYQYLHFDTIDLMLKIKCYKTSSTDLKIFGGVKLASINQKLTVNTQGLLYSGVLFPSGYENSEMLNRFKGVGLEIGGSAIFPIRWGIGIDFESIFALLAGAYHLNYNDQLNVSGSSNLSNEQSWVEKSIALAIDIRGQLFWEKRFSKYRKIKLFVGFDTSYWPDQILVTHTARLTDSSIYSLSNLTLGNGNLSLYGYRFGANFGF